MTKLILASTSPRRAELLSPFDFDLEIVKPSVEEKIRLDLPYAEMVKLLARQKGESVIDSLSGDAPLLSADTIVVINDKVFGKPKDRAEAQEMLKCLSGKTHFVFTGAAIFFKGKVAQFAVKSEVTFKRLSLNEIERYCDTKEPYDKAGGYALQGIGSFMVKSINGSYSNVIGLPVCEVIEQFQELGIIQR